MDSLANDLQEKAAIGVPEETNGVTAGPSVTIDAAKMTSRCNLLLGLTNARTSS